MRLSSLLLPGLGAAVLAAAVALPAEGATIAVSVKDNVFAPKAKTVKRGDVVRFVWRGRSAHNVVISGPKRAASNIQVKGSYRFRATKAGAHRVVCTLHPGMQMRLRVR
jgi:plastocyanin